MCRGVPYPYKFGLVPVFMYKAYKHVAFPVVGYCAAACNVPACAPVVAGYIIRIAAGGKADAQRNGSGCPFLIPACIIPCICGKGKCGLSMTAGQNYGIIKITPSVNSLTLIATSLKEGGLM